MHLWRLQLAYLADKLVGNCLGTNLISSEGSLEEQPQGEIWLYFGKCRDRLQAKLKNALTFLQPSVILEGEGRVDATAPGQGASSPYKNQIYWLL